MTETALPARHIGDFRAGVIAILPLVVAVIPFALILGANGVARGLSVSEVVLMSALVFAGSSQFLAIDLWTHPAPALSLGATALLINLRHVLMGASLSGKLDRFSSGGRLLAVFFMADEIWALAERRALDRPLTPAFYAGLAVPLYLNWVLLTGLGAALGGLVDDPAAFGFDFAFTAVFIGLVAGFWKGRQSLAVAAASAAGAIAVHALVEGAWFVIAGALAGVTVAALTAGPDKVEARP
ncbi:AzlC family ABC transporter permease [Methylobrevis pamukkalensis]|uniref:Inner membrane protein YgaZ n=1 Tax=Methylobrevis pamukkalensis TaxID=1439726 RepID=A0A1E3H558_9HYPH|nr:AzlC family ABC transporter permease [Methylobrevis pamukkalensis]ODN71442.1 Inner membrane protein YgaZ [Methylobrevis pamukkalensis]